MSALEVVVVQPPVDPGPSSGYVLVRGQVDLLVLQGSPQSLDEHVVEAAPSLPT